MFMLYADFMTSSNLEKLSSMEQLMFFLLKVSDAAPKTDTSLAPAAIWERTSQNNFLIFSMYTLDQFSFKCQVKWKGTYQSGLSHIISFSDYYCLDSVFSNGLYYSMGESICQRPHSMEMSIQLSKCHQWVITSMVFSRMQKHTLTFALEMQK